MPRKPPPDDSIMIVAAPTHHAIVPPGAATRNDVCADCGTPVTGAPRTYGEAMAHPDRRGRPIRYVCSPCAEQYDFHAAEVRDNRPSHRHDQAEQHVIQIMGLYTGQPHKLDGLYVTAYDPSFAANGDPGACLLTGTADPRQAKHFTDVAEAYDYAKQVNLRDPIREDGRPNRPITAFTIRFCTLANAVNDWNAAR